METIDVDHFIEENYISTMNYKARSKVAMETIDVDHFIEKTHISTVNYHGEVSVGQRVENLNKFKSNSEDFPTLVCTGLAARGKTARMDAKGKNKKFSY